MEIFNPYFYAENINLMAYEHAWVRYIKSGERNEKVIAPEIYSSWDRCKRYNIDPLSEYELPVVSESDLERRLAKNRYVLQIIEPFMDILFDIVNKSDFVIALSDREGVVIKLLLDPLMSETCKRTNLCAGADRRESAVGNSSINMAINLKRPVQLTGCQHFRQSFQHCTSASSPVFTQTGEVLCVLSIIGKYEYANEHTLGMVYSITKAIENQHSMNNLNRNLSKKNRQLEDIFSMLPDSVIYMENNNIIQINAPMLAMLGKDKSETIGKNVYDIVRTKPSISELLRSETPQNSGYVLLRGGDRTYKGLLSIEEIKSDSEKSSNEKILRFTRSKTIEQMMSKMHFAARYSFADLVGDSPAFLEAVSMAKKAAKFNSRVLITGESGTGKEMFAQAIHNDSSRKNAPFIAVDCGAIPSELFESEFFGYEPGAFTGAKKEGKEGLVERANGGTLFLDEVGNLALDMQQKLLRMLQEGVVSRVGGSDPINIDIRVIAATNAALEEEVEKGTFREDLYYRLNVLNINVPSLRSRTTDIPLLVNSILKQSFTDRNIQVSVDAMNALMKYEWPGNVRQLQNAVERAVIMSDMKTIRVENLPDEISESDGASAQAVNTAFTSEPVALDEMIGNYVRHVLAASHGNISKAARQLGVSRTTIYNYLSRETETGGTRS